MKVVVTAAGSSQRFYEAGFSVPKYMLMVRFKPMLQRVMEMFSTNDSFLIVTTLRQQQMFQSFFENISEQYANVTITGIEEHSLGPAYTVMSPEVIDWIGNDNFVVTYCDFVLKWDYSKFIAEISAEDPAGAIVSFEGLQPASRGSTYFAYLKTHSNHVLEVREKKSFTAQRSSEIASAGIYYFKSISHYIQGYHDSLDDFAEYKEQYVSLIFNALIRKSHLVIHFAAHQFLCLGTPFDYEEMIFWEEFFDSTKLPSPDFDAQLKIIPMAGFGERFRRAGIKVPKPFLPIRNQPIFAHAMNSFPRASESIVISLEGARPRIERSLQGLNLKTKVYVLPEETSGPGETLLAIKPFINHNGDAVVMSCDYEHLVDRKVFNMETPKGVASIAILYTSYNPLRMKNASAFAYCEADEAGVVSRIVEKELLSDTPANDKLLVGTFWFQNVSLLFSALEIALSANMLVNGELCVAFAINAMIRRGYVVKAIPVTHWISYGDPDEVEIYQWWESIFEFLDSD